VRPPYKCEKRCISIKTAEKSVVIRQGDVIYTTSCGKAIDVSTGEEIWPANHKSKTNPDLPPILLMFCTNVMDNPAEKSVLTLSDCFNGTLLEPGHFGNETNITHILQSHLEATNSSTSLLDPTARMYAPPEQDLLIWSDTPLLINDEACVNTLILNECETFHAEYGGDGADLRSQSRFQCYYAPNYTQEHYDRYGTNFVVLRFSRMTTILQLMIASCIPITLAIVSCLTLIICTRMIHVGDDSHFYFQCCGADAQATLEKEAVEAMAL